MKKYRQYFYIAAKRVFDFTFALVCSIILFIPLIIIAFLIKITSEGPVFHWSKRVGINNSIFMMAKFRTMKINTPQVATHLMKNPEIYVTKIGKLLRKFSIDELPQIINILKGDISFVGPRPALFNQDDLISLRTEKNVHTIQPGLTGLAQINGRDELPIPVKVNYDELYLLKRTFFFDIKIILITFVNVITSKGIDH